MIERLGHSLYETVDKVPEIGDTFYNKVIMSVHKIYPSVYEIHLEDYSIFIVEVV